MEAQLSPSEQDAAVGSPPVLRAIAPGRSCVACRRRKIRCNRKQPCAYCTRLKTHCVYPGHQSTSFSNQRRSPVAEDVLDRLARVEESLHQLREHQRDGVDNGAQVHEPAYHGSNDAHLEHCQSSTPAETADTVDSVMPNEERPHGASVASIAVDSTRARCVNGGFWATLETALPDRSADDLEASQSAPVTTRDFYRGPFSTFGIASCSAEDQVKFHPQLDRVFPLWQVYIEAVDPLLKILHIPTTQRQLLQATQTLGEIPPSFEALMLAIYYAAVSSMQTSVCSSTVMDEERQELLNKYGLGVEQALAKAKLITDPDLFGLQAFTLFLICARSHRDHSLIWTLTGTAIRLATRMGLHREPATLGLTPFDCEMRRRLWWQIVVLDAQTAQDNDVDPSIYEHSFDTRRPANVDDSALDPSMSTIAIDSSSCTEMLFPLRMIELTRTARRLLFSRPFTHANTYPNISYLEQLDSLTSLQTQLAAHDATMLDGSTPICILTQAYTSMEVARMKLVLHQLASCDPVQQQRHHHSATSLPLAAAIIEISRAILHHLATLRANTRQRKWLWLVQRDPEWPAVAALLMVERQHSCVDGETWRLVDEAMQRWAHQEAVWLGVGRLRLLKRLYVLARTRREDEGVL